MSGSETKWRLIELSENDAYDNMAIDEAILEERILGRVPDTLRLYTWRPSAVSVGYFQSIAAELDLEACRSLDVDVIRRASGGGAVYHHQGGEVTYSIVVHEEGRSRRDVMESFKRLSSGLVQALKYMRVEAEFKPINDVVVRGKKISGCAQTRRKGTTLHHGTLLIDLDLEVMSSVLRVSAEKLMHKDISSIAQRVTSLTQERGARPTMKEVKIALAKGFERALDAELEPGELTENERDRASSLRKKYSSEDWTFRRQ